MAYDKTVYYKYRSLENFKFIVDILVNERLYATSYENMNDAMEGVYYRIGVPRSVLKDIKEEKKRLKICSLSKDCNVPLLWAHYANGSRGICIGLVITGHGLDKRDIEYKGTPEISSIRLNFSAKEILTYKHESWNYESELRVFTEKSFVKIKIEEIILGVKISKTDKSLVKKLVSKVLPDVRITELKSN